MQTTLGQFNEENLITSAVLAPFAIATNFLGIWLVQVMPNDVFYRVIYAIVFVIALALIYNGVAGMWPGA